MSKKLKERKIYNPLIFYQQLYSTNSLWMLCCGWARWFPCSNTSDPNDRDQASAELYDELIIQIRYVGAGKHLKHAVEEVPEDQDQRKGRNK